MDSENAAEETMPSSLSSLISLAFASASSSSAQQPYFSELLSFNLDCLQKIFFELMRSRSRGKCKRRLLGFYDVLVLNFLGL
nr:hypothetical protein CFP56_78115 [Quercus suber]